MSCSVNGTGASVVRLKTMWNFRPTADDSLNGVRDRTKLIEVMTACRVLDAYK